MASSTSQCGICDLRHVSKPAVVWCSDCDEGFCTDCSEHHSLSKLSRHHATTPIDDYQKLPAYIQEIEQFCTEHNEQFILFCKNHDSPCCRTCVVQTHNACQNISKIEDVVQNVKTSTAFHETAQILNELAENIQKILKDKEENLVSLENSKIQVEKEIKEFRVKVNNHLDKLQEDLVKELHSVEQTERKEIQRLADDLKQKEKDIKEIQVSFSNIQQYASDLQAHLSMKQIQSDIGKTENEIDSLANSENLEQNVISLEINAAMKDILTSLKKFGNIAVEGKGFNVVIIKKKNQQAQLLVPKICQQRTIDNITLQLQQTLNVDISNIRGCCMLPDGRLVFTSYSMTKRLIFMNADGTQNTTLKIPSEPFDVIYMEYNNSLAVTSDYPDKCITFINIKSNKVQESIQLNSLCYGIAEKNNTLFFCDGENIKSLHLTDKSVTKCINFTSVLYSYIAIHENNLYHTNNYTNTVTCYDLCGQVKWKFKKESIIKGPTGVTVDNQGNVYVAGYKTSNVVVISPDGQNCRELLSTKDKLTQPKAISYDRSTDNLLIANEKGKAFLYKVSSI